MEVSFLLAKYSFKFKKEVVKAYLNGEGSYRTIAERFGIPAMRLIQTWVSNFNAFGDEGLIRSHKNKSYTFEEKLAIVEAYLTTETSYQALALEHGITNPSMITGWVIAFRIAGPDALREKKRGRKMTIKRKSAKVKTAKIDTSERHVKELEDENLRLRIENAYLKEKRRLRLEEEALQKRKQGSSTVSEDPSN